MAKNNFTRPCSHCCGTGKENDPVLFGRHMRALRERAHKSLRSVAEAMSVSAPYLSDMECGHRNFTDEMVAKFNKAIAK